MSVFEDLIDELKNENLLEDTVINKSRANAAVQKSSPVAAAAAAGISTARPAAVAPGVPLVIEADRPEAEKHTDDLEFFRKRATEEVASLQMVDHVLSGVERLHMKVASAAFDDLNTKKALHKFLQITSGPNSREHAEAEFELRQETEAWNFALYARDAKISVANLRRFCEESRPALSSQALIALARFYRNATYSEDSRSKFEYAITRLFTREPEMPIREPLFGHREMIGHLNTLYANWSSIALYTNEDDQVEVSLAVTRLDEFEVEVENAETFDELLESNFFGRVREFKKEAAEMFYVPEVLAAAIQCNLTIGNRYVELMARERVRNSAAKVEEKYGDTHDQMISDVTGKTLLLADVLTVEVELPEPEPDPERPVERAPLPVTAAYVPSSAEPVTHEEKGSRSGLFGLNKWLMIFCIALVLAGGGVYVWAENESGGAGDALTSKPIVIEDAEVKKYLKNSSFTNETLFAITDPMFDTLTEDERKAVLTKVWEFARSQNLQKVNLLNNKGRSVAFASNDRMELIP